MKKMEIFDPAMCCSTGVCGPSIDKNLLRVSTVINRLDKKGIKVERFNLASQPQNFIDNNLVNELLNKDGVEILPITIVDGRILKTKEYPTNKEFADFLDIPESHISLEVKKINIK